MKRHRLFPLRTLLPALGLATGLALAAAPADAATLPPVNSGDLIVHLDSDAVTTDANGNVDSWNDQETTNSSNGVTDNDFTASDTARPVLVSNATPTGKSALRFDGKQFMTGDEFFDFSEFTIFAVARGKRGDGNLGSIFWDYGDDTKKLNRVALTTGFDAQVRSADPTNEDKKHTINATTDSSADAEQWNVITSRLSGQTLELYVNSELEASGNNDDYDITTTWEGTEGDPTIGRISNSDVHNLDGDIAALLIYRGALSDTDRAAVESELFNTFVIPEPATAAMVGLGGVILLTRRRRA